VGENAEQHENNAETARVPENDSLMVNVFSCYDANDFIGAVKKQGGEADSWQHS
jgi:hypothetical protein